MSTTLAGSLRGPGPDESPISGRRYQYYDLIMAAFVTVLLCSNLIGPAKACMVSLFGVTLAFGAGNLFFPLSYIFGDVLTEVYGYARSRKVIWAGFAAMVFYVVMAQIIIRLPADPREPFNQQLQPALETCFGAGPRIVVASMLAFWLGDFANSYVLAKMKVLTRGRFLWMRTIGSTIVGQGIDSIVFYPLAFASLDNFAQRYGISLPLILRGGWNADTVFRLALFNWFFKTAVEAVMTPVTYWVVARLKRAEREDFYDDKTNFTPFSLRDE
ncbi:MAG: queuosine precursor transporter [Planctomycetes bacterium]|nr:queuosine precursor transporter [Planctomycetota bacterium]